MHDCAGTYSHMGIICTAHGDTITGRERRNNIDNTLDARQLPSTTKPVSNAKEY